MSTAPTRVLVTGSEYPAGLAGVRALDRAGFEVWAAVETPWSLGARSRAAAGLVQVPDARTEPEAFVGALADAAKRLGAAAVLPGTEAALLALGGRADAFPESVAVGNAPETALRRATDKTALSLLSLRAGLNVPPTRVVGAEGSLASYDLTFPAVVKPLRSELATEGVLRRYEAARVESPAELEAALQDLPDAVGIVQPYLEGRLISVNGVAFEGEVHALHQHVVHRVWPDRCGQAVNAETIPMVPERERAVGAFMAELGWSGVFNLQLIERDGQDHVIDLNPRFYVSMTLAVAAGRNLPAIWAALLLGRPYEAGGFRTGMRFRHEQGDPRAIVCELRRGHWRVARDLLPRRRTVHAVFSMRDPRPTLRILREELDALRLRRSGALGRRSTTDPAAV